MLSVSIKDCHFFPLQFKKGCRENPGKYRPVSLKSVVGKLLESILRDKIHVHLDRQGLIVSLERCRWGM